jgi:hypothetical protein
VIPFVVSNGGDLSDFFNDASEHKRTSAVSN